MRFGKKILTLSFVAVGAGGVLAGGPALAGDIFQELGPVGSQDLAAERGMAFEVDDDALAKAVGYQNQYVIINGEAVGSAGTINMGTDTFGHQVMSTNVINSGNNSVFQVQNVIAVTVTGGAP